MFDNAGAHELLTRHFATQSLRGFGLEGDDPRIGAAGAALRYASASHRRSLDHVQSLRVDNEGDYLQLDAATLANLEILDSRDAGRPRASLWSVVNATRSAMGARTLRRWITRVCSLQQIRILPECCRQTAKNNHDTTQKHFFHFFPPRSLIHTFLRRR